jgi:hypothetical protein
MRSRLRGEALGALPRIGQCLPHGAGMGQPQRAPDRVDVLAGVVRDYD